MCILFLRGKRKPHRGKQMFSSLLLICQSGRYKTIFKKVRHRMSVFSIPGLCLESWPNEKKVGMGAERTAQ